MGRASGEGRGKQEQVLSPVLLLGSGVDSPASAALPLLASHLRRHGIESYVHMSYPPECDAPGAPQGALERYVQRLLERVQPRLVGVSLKWFLHLERALRLCKIIREVCPETFLVVGGNTATWFWRELIEFPAIDCIVLGDGERPLLQLCQSHPAPSNCVMRRGDRVVQTPRDFVISDGGKFASQLTAFDELFLSKKDLHLSGFLVLGRGCSQSCLYCGGCAEAQWRTFRRKRPFRRPLTALHDDIRQLSPCFTIATDFDDVGIADWSTFHEKLWLPELVSQHVAGFFSWRALPQEMLDLLSSRFRAVHLILDVVALSEPQRLRLRQDQHIRPAMTDRELFSTLARCDEKENVEVTVSGIAGLPLLEPDDLERSSRFVERLCSFRSVTGLMYTRLHAQPGAPVAENPAAFGMSPTPRSFADYRDILNSGEFHVRFPDRELNRAVADQQQHANQLFAGRSKRTWDISCQPLLRLEQQAQVLHARPCAVYHYTLAEWEGEHTLPPRANDPEEPVVVIDAGPRQQVLTDDSARSATRVLRQFSEPRSLGRAHANLRRQGMTPQEFAKGLRSMSEMGLLNRV